MFNSESDTFPYTNAEEVHILQGKIMKKKNANNKVPYGRKRSCWKKNYSAGQKKRNNYAGIHVTIEEGSINKSIPEAGVITCAVCGIQRYYKFIKQTKKFGLHSCEPCRKFISSLIQHVKHGDQIELFRCAKKGPENCLITESFPFRTGSTKSKKDALSNMRCKACWLALCLEKYQMPIGLRNSLVLFIAEDDRPVFSTSDMENPFDEIDFKPLTKRKSQNSSEEKSCLKVLCENFLEKSGLNERFDDNKVVILRIKC